MILLKFKKLFDQAIIPTKKHPSDAGWDLYAIEDSVIPAGEQRSIGTGIQLAGIEFPFDYNDGLDIPDEYANHCVLQIWPRSGMDAKKGLHTGAGIVDQNYRGEIIVLLKNMSNQTQYIVAGDKIAQMIPLYLPFSEVEEVTEVEETDRGESSGINEFKKEEARDEDKSETQEFDGERLTLWIRKVGKEGS